MLPNVSLAVLDPAKVRDYLLSPSHPVGRFKAAVFLALGYTQHDWSRLREDLLAHARSGQVTAGERGSHGQKYVVSGTLTGPNGRAGKFTSVWLVPKESSAPRFVTAYPE